jgi:hypothetical protein
MAPSSLLVGKTLVNSDTARGNIFSQGLENLLLKRHLEPVINFLKEKSVHCKYNPALSWGWQQNEKVIRVMSATKNGIFV